MKRTCAVLMVLATASAVGHADILIGEGEYFRVWMTDPSPVGSGLEDLVASELRVRNISGNPEYNPAAVAGLAELGGSQYAMIRGSLHNEQFPAPFPPYSLLPSPDLDSSGGSTVDTHWLVSPTGDDYVVAEPLSEPIVSDADSAEPGQLGGSTGFTGYLRGAWALTGMIDPDTFSVARIVVPDGSWVQLDGQFAGGGVADEFHGSFQIPEPGTTMLICAGGLGLFLQSRKRGTPPPGA